ncbi:hypothetical protein SprV_0301355600 [Sparganum proliferum]
MASNDSPKDSLDINTPSFKLPPFTPSNPRVWFRQIEALFATSRITSERTRYSYVSQSLPFDVAVTVEDLLDPIPVDEPYTRLKEAVIQRVAKSANLMLRELFTQVELGDQTPSQLMRHMRSLLAVKRPRQPVMATTPAGQSRPSRLFYINDKSSGLRFLVDTGAESKAKPIELSPAAHSALEEAKKALADATMLHHLSSDAHEQLILTTDASSSAVGAVLHQQVDNQLQPLAFFSQKLQPAQTRYSTFSRELLAIYLTIRHFRHLLEGRHFSVHTDHKPLTYALKAKPDRYSPREVRHLDYISQFTADIRYVRGSDNVVADALSRPHINTLTSDFDLAKLADLQTADESIADLRTSTTLQLRDAPLPASPGTILCDWSTGTPRPVVPLPYRKVVFDHFHSLSHPGIRAGRRLTAARFVWPKMNSDIALWTKQCLACQKNKVHRHTFSPPSTFAVPDVRFNHVHLDLIGLLPPSRGYTHILTAVDRFTRWPIAVPISDTSAENIAMVFLTHWISTFGVTATLTTDRGSQFQSSLFLDNTQCSLRRRIIYSALSKVEFRLPSAFIHLPLPI